MKIEVERWEIDLILNGLGKIPYEESGATIQRIKERVEPTIIHCDKCAWFAPVESMPAADAMHKNLHELFDGVLPSREGETGVCRKVTFCAERPVLVNSNGYCHLAETN